MFKRQIYQLLRNRMLEPRRFIQVLSGPRQVGKTTLIRQVMNDIRLEIRYVSADEPSLHGLTWLEQQWQIARMLPKGGESAVLVLDEIQKIPNWSETVKRLWDEDTISGLPLKIILLGSAPLLIQQGLTESLAGRFEIIHATHWSFAEMKAAFGWNVQQYIYFGAYPGAAFLIEDENRWRNYINDSLIETTISRDILLMNRIDKPALLRQLFQLGCQYSGQIMSYQKMLGQLHDAGNTTTLAHYLKLLTNTGILTGLEKYSGTLLRQKKSSPKLQVFNMAIMTAQSNYSFSNIIKDLNIWGRWLESAVATHLINQAIIHHGQLYYWREGQQEVDFILVYKEKIIAIEVKNGIKKTSTSGLKTFQNLFHPNKLLLVGPAGIPFEEFFLMSLYDFI